LIPLLLRPQIRAGAGVLTAAVAEPEFVERADPPEPAP
jgi:hypothetical protein